MAFRCAETVDAVASSVKFLTAAATRYARRTAHES